MTAASLSAASALTLAGAIGLALVGRAIARRRVSAGNAAAKRFFSAWWWGMSASFAIGALEGLVAAWAPPAAEAFGRAANYPYVLAIGVALWGLLSYLVFLRTGRDRSRPIGALYAAVVLAAAAHMAAFPPRVEVGEWAVNVVASQGGAALHAAFLVAFLLPQLVAIGAYAALYRRAPDAETRRRVAVVSASLAAWIGAPLAAAAVGAATAEGFLVMGRALGLAASLAILWAYSPRGRVRSA